MEKIPNAHIQVIDGNAKINEIFRNSVKHEYNITVLTGQARVVDNTVYFPGWTVLIDNKITDIQFQDPSERGLITFYVPKGKHDVKVVFKDTKFRTLSDIVSAVTFIVLLIFAVYLIFKKRK